MMIEPRITRYRIIENRLGSFVLMLTERNEIHSTWLGDDGWGIARISGAVKDGRLLPELSNRLRRYFAGDRVDFSDDSLPTGPAFWRRCWRLCREIPAGRTCSYGELARRAGQSHFAARAVGQAMRHNPLPVIIPCHRVIASNGSLHGFGGTSDPASASLTLKRRLLELEGWVEHPTTRSAATLFDAASRPEPRLRTMASTVR